MEENEIPSTSRSEVEGLIRQIRKTNLDPAAKNKIERLLRTVLMMVNLLEKKNATLTKLQKLIFGKKSESNKQRKRGGGTKSEERDDPEGEAEPSEKTEKNEGTTQARAGGHGHRAISEYHGAAVVECENKELEAGDECPGEGCQGHLYDLKAPKTLLQFKSEPLINATVYKCEVLRCSSCQQRYEATPPTGVKNETYDATCDATITVMKYGMGMPWTRMEELQRMRGVPLSKTTLWERSAETARIGKSIFNHLLKLAANGEICHLDDTRVRILSCLGEDKKEKGSATQTTGFVAVWGERKIALYQSGRAHAGINLAKLLENRAPGRSEMITMSDALSANLSRVKDVKSGYCIVHARREIFDLREKYPAESKIVLDAVSMIYDNERKARSMPPAERLALHQEKSGPIMSGLREWIEAQLGEGKVEPNSDLGKALRYWVRHWERLTLWLRVEGAPLDNNEAERALRKAVLIRNNSLFYKTPKGAEAGDILSSLIQTCRLNGVDAWDYLVTIIRNEAEALRSPERYLPWNYREARMARAA